MHCALCNSTGATYRLVGPDSVTVCEQCVAEHLTADPDDPTCHFCEREGEYDLAEHTGDISGEDDMSEYETFAEKIVCQDHLDELRAETNG